MLNLVTAVIVENAFAENKSEDWQKSTETRDAWEALGKVWGSL